MPLLRVIDADGTHVHPLDDETVTIGRGPGNKIILKDLASSSRHAQVVKDTAGWRLEDRGSLNGTFVNGAQVQKKPLVTGDRIQIGSTEIVFELSQAPPLPETRLTPPKREAPAAAGPGYANSFLQSMVGDDFDAPSTVSNPLLSSLVIDDEAEPDTGGSRFAFLRADGGSIEEDTRTMMFTTQLRPPGNSGSALLPHKVGETLADVKLRLIQRISEKLVRIFDPNQLMNEIMTIVIESTGTTAACCACSMKSSCPCQLPCGG